MILVWVLKLIIYCSYSITIYAQNTIMVLLDAMHKHYATLLHNGDTQFLDAFDGGKIHVDDKVSQKEKGTMWNSKGTANSEKPNAQGYMIYGNCKGLYLLYL